MATKHGTASPSWESSRIGRWLGLLVALTIVEGSSAAEERLTVEQAVQLALKQNLPLNAARKRAIGAHDLALGSGANLLPKLRLFDLYQHWNCPSVIALQNSQLQPTCQSDAPALPAPDLSAFTPAQQAQIATALGNIGFSGAPPILRKEDTNVLILSVDQPIIQMPRIGFEFAAVNETAKAADAGVKAGEAQVKQTVQTQFLRMFQARAQERIAAASVEELRAQVKDARARLQADVITRADLLRVEVAEANEEQQQIDAQADAVTAKARLLDAIGLASTTDVDFVEPDTVMTAAAEPLPDFGTASQRALHRPEVAQSARNEHAARNQRLARLLALLPDVDFVGAYTRFDNQFFLPANQWFAGVSANWTFWEWGATYFPARAAARAAEAAALELENQRRSVVVDVQVAFERTRAAATAVEVAKKSIASAQEAYNEVVAQVKADTATTTDLLEAQAALTRARLNLSRAQYELAIQHVSLVRAMGN